MIWKLVRNSAFFERGVYIVSRQQFARKKKLSVVNSSTESIRRKLSTSS